MISVLHFNYSNCNAQMQKPNHNINMSIHSLLGVCHSPSVCDVNCINVTGKPLRSGC